MIMVGKPDDDASDEGTAKLTQNIDDRFTNGHFTDRHEGNGHGGIDLCAAVTRYGINADEDGPGPSGGDNDPTGVLGLCLSLDDNCNHPRSKINQTQGTH